MTERSATAGKRPAKLSLDPVTAPSVVESLSCCVLIKYPEVQRAGGLKAGEFLGGFREQP